jgi:hypothetical protein
MIKQHHCLMVAFGCIKSIIKHHEDVHVVGNGLLRDKRTEHEETCQVPCCSSNAVNPCNTLKQDLTLTARTAKHSSQFCQSGSVDSDRKVASGVQRRKWNCPSPSATNDGGNGAAAKKNYDFKTRVIGGSRSPRTPSMGVNLWGASPLYENGN